MADVPDPNDLPVPLVPDMIHRPDVPRHMMRVKPVTRHITMKLGEEVLARTVRALLVTEIGHDVHDPVLYVPLEDVAAALVENARSTHCPLKGDTTYFDLEASGDRSRVADIGWVYSKPKPWAAMLEEHVAFDGARVTTIDEPPARRR